MVACNCVIELAPIVCTEIFVRFIADKLQLVTDFIGIIRLPDGVPNLLCVIVLAYKFARMPD